MRGSDSDEGHSEKRDQTGRTSDLQTADRPSTSNVPGADEPAVPTEQPGHAEARTERKSGSQRKRVRDVAEDIEMRERMKKAKQLRAEKRNDILWDYYEKTWHSLPVNLHSHYFIAL